MQNKKLLTIITISIILALPLILAASWGGGYFGYGSPLDYLENEWVLFTILFLIFFSAIFYTLNKAMKNASVSVIIALGLSILISLAISRKGLLWGYGDGLDSWILLISLLIGLAFLLRFAYESFGKFGVALTLLIMYILILYIEPETFIPSSLLYGGFSEFWEYLRGIIGVGILIIAFIWAFMGKKQEDPLDFIKNIFGGRKRR